MEISELFSLDIGYWLLQTLAMIITALLIPGLKISSIFGAFTSVVLLAFVNSKLWDAALFFSLPDKFSTEALLLLLANGVVFWIVIKILPGIEIKGILPALLAPIVFTICSLLIARYEDRVDWGKVAETSIEFVSNVKDHFLEQKEIEQ